jgi:hypothetical protein
MAEAGCPHTLCPYIMENLDDLRRDRDFIEAVEDADELLTHHTPTLMYLNSIGFPDERAMRLPLPTPVPALPVLPIVPPPLNPLGVAQDCGGCPFPRVGFFCHGEDGACTKTDYNAALERGRTPCPA